MEFWILTILAVISVVYCCDFPVIIDMPWLINNHDSIFYGIGQSIVAAYIFYLIQVVIATEYVYENVWVLYIMKLVSLKII